jgi:hypothetical protein
MSVSTVHVLHGILLSGSTFISQLTDTTPASNHEELIGRASGHPDPLFIANRGVRPDVTFNSTQLKTLLDAVGSDYAADLSAGNTDLFYKKVTNLGTREAAASTVHKRMRMASGILYVESIGAAHQQDAAMSCRIVPIYNGTNNPIVPAGSLALAGTPAVTSFFTLGPVVINSSQLPGVQSWRLMLGNSMLELGGDGEIFNTFCAIGETEPFLEVSGLEHAWDTYGLEGTAVSALTFALRKKATDGSNVANGTAEHIVFTGSGGKIGVVNTQGGGNSPAATTLRIPLRATSSSGAVVSFNSATTIS